MSTDRSQVEMISAGQTLQALEAEERLRVVRKLTLTIETQVLLKKPESIQVITPVPPEALESLIVSYLRTGFLPRQSPQDLLQALILLTRCHPVPIYPTTADGAGDISEVLGQMQEEEGELALELLDLFQKMMADRVISVEFAAAYVSDALVNYKTSSKKFQKYQKHIQSLLQQDLRPESPPSPSS